MTAPAPAQTQATLTVPGSFPAYLRPEPTKRDPHMGSRGGIGRVDLGYVCGAPVRLEGDAAYMKAVYEAAYAAWIAVLRFDGGLPGVTR